MSTTTTLTETTPKQVVVAADVPTALAPAEEDAVFQAVARGDRAGNIKLKGIPTFTDPYRQRRWMKEHMAAAFRFFGKEGYAEGVSGHISIRDPVLKDHFWMNPFAKHFCTIKASDLVLVDDEGYVTEGGAQLPINEAGFMIHSEIHKARPDVIAAAHTHGVYGKTWSAFGRPIEMLTQGAGLPFSAVSIVLVLDPHTNNEAYIDACNFYGKLSVYSDHGGIALAQEEGQRIAKALGRDNIACILKNHGLLTVGRTVDEAAFLFASLDHACHSQLMAEAAAANGIPKQYITHEVAQYTADAVQNPHNFYTEFQPYFEQIVEESKGEVLQ
ncbi:class II aldolase/adducin domain protein [Aspergillus ochraceoroseus]|uniref:Class II aldolase/adducin domain protein n=1 Tax=Aspergillus ochraceoroseus TaxID=138278 RepID=A0A0F8X4H6_9EURO|nr:class II aldolase/adducin domain protein [Aspergillus ochraceoroseus]